MTDRAQLVSLDNVVPYLLQAQLLSSADAVDRDLEVEDRTRRNRNFKVVRAEGPGLLVKQSGNPNDEGMRATLEAEAELLRAVALDPSLRPARWFAPAFVHHLRRDAVLVTELVHPATSMTKDHLNGGDVHFPEDAAVTAGRILATFHETLGAAARAGHLPFVPRTVPYAWTSRDAFRRPAREVGAASATFGKLLDEHAGFYDRLPALRERWAASDGVVHGDVRWDNFLLTAGPAPADNLNLRLIDWELVTRGDPAWDVSAFLAEYVRFWFSTTMMHRTTDLDDVRRRAPVPLERCHASARAFVAAYARRRRLAEKGRRELLARIHDYFPFNLVVIGFENLQRQTHVPGVSRAALTMAARAAEEPAAALAEWLGLEDGA